MLKEMLVQIGGTLETGIKLLTRMLFKIDSQDKVHDMKAREEWCACKQQ